MKSKLHQLMKPHILLLLVFVFSHCIAHGNPLEMPQDKAYISIALSILNPTYSTEQIKQGQEVTERTVREKIPEVKISLLGQARDVYFLGKPLKEAISITDGVLVLELSKKVLLPYQFVLKIEAKEHVTTFKHIQINSSNPHHFPIFLGSIKSSSNATFNQQSQINIKNNITKETKVLGEDNFVEVRILEGTKFSPKLGNSINNSSSAEIKLSYNVADTSNALTFPSGYNGVNILPKPNTLPKIKDFPIKIYKKQFTKLTQETNPFYLLPYCWINMEISVGQQNITYFDKPIEIKVNFPNYDSDDQSTLKDGNMVPLWSLSEDGIWRKETEVRISKINNQCTANFQINHLTIWALGVTPGSCSADLTVKYTANSSTAEELFSQLVHDPSGINFELSTGSNHITYLGNDAVTISNIPENLRMKFVAYDDNTGPGMVRSGVKVTSFGCNLRAHEILDLNSANPLHALELHFFKDVGGNNSQAIGHSAFWFINCASCSSSDASELSRCTNERRAFQFGGHTNADGKIVFSQRPPFDGFYCIRLWVGSSNLGDAIGSSEWLDILVDLDSTGEINGIDQNDAIFGVTHQLISVDASTQRRLTIH